jgi:quinol-cytochrome oxidoreductase complex cytochrome b subunit
MIYSMLNKEYKVESEKLAYNFGLDLSLILFIILFFGSFLVGDYNNGALDFIYFIGTLIIRQKLITNY